MRIIAGELRGRAVEGPPGRGTRPMLDRVREALFSTLGPGIEGAWVLDLFAGSGSLGLEALSRGAAFARFVERDAGVVRVLAGNVASLGVEDRSEVVGGSALGEAAWRAPAGQPARWADLVLLDPPYPWLADERRAELLRAVPRLVREVLRPEGLLVFHTPKRGVQASDFDAAFEPDPRLYGNSALWYLRAPAEPEAEAATSADAPVEGEA
ncbi:MAG: 16S rRNA (guanine(966)-N(2))-methyltransferase RsmD [Planctomycetes bacterium]|nr:16S rRNA (guanine(966)-N(2))-methyltransferase RsmD [Planctomycetota bacterium]